MKKKSVLFCLLAVLAAGLSVFLLVRGNQGSGAFRGSFVKNSDSYLLNAERMTGTGTHTLALQKGDVLQIHFAVEKGSLKLTITAPDSTELYAGNGTEAEDFTVNIRGPAGSGNAAYPENRRVNLFRRTLFLDGIRASMTRKGSFSRKNVFANGGSCFIMAGGK